jgi:Holliday junction resolvase RusA-like endonuclease
MARVNFFVKLFPSRDHDYHWQAEVANRARQCLRGRALKGPVSVCLQVNLERPENMPARQLPSLRKPALLNLTRQALAALASARAIEDPRQVVALTARKAWAQHAHQHGVLVQVSELGHGLPAD